MTYSSHYTKGSRYYTRLVRKPVVTITKKPVLRPGVITKPKMVERPMNPSFPASQPKPGPDGCYELDAVTSRALEDELQKIMIKVWQALPDDVPTDEEKMVVEKIKNEASDDVRNALGLNVTQRLLNTFNPLNVKVHFSTKPERKYLRHFLKKYNFVAFKRIVRVNNTFAAQVKTIADYDDLCSNKNIYCGAAKITISPCYRFIQCPKNLKTIYGIPEEDIPVENKDSIDQEAKEMNKNNDVPKESIKVKEETKYKSAIKNAKEPDVNIVEEIKPTVKESNIITKPYTGKATEAANTTTKPVDVQKTSVALAKSATTAKSVENKPQNIPTTETPSNTQTKSTTVTKKPEIVKAKVTEDNKTTASNTTAKTITKVATKAADNKDDKTKPPYTDAPNTNTVVSTQKPSDSKVSDTSAVKPVITKPIESKVTTLTGAKAVVTKPTESKDSNEAATSAQVVNSKITTVNTKTINVATKTTNVITTKPNVTTTKTDVKNDKPTVTNTKPANITTKPAEVTKNGSPAKTTKATPTKAQQTKTVTNPKVNVKNVSKQVVKKADAKKQADTKKPSKGDDFEELDDQELYLYLMSAGIVLDECSGSDEE